MRKGSVIGIVAGVVLLAGAASGQEQPQPPPAGPAPWSPAVQAPPAPPPEGDASQKPPADKDKDKDKDKEEVKDGVRARGGFNINGGIVLLPNDASTIGPAFGFSGRIGVQINHYLAVVYQNTPIVTFTAQSSGQGATQSAGFKAGFADYNSFLLVLTLGHFFDIGAGPSVDFLALANYNASLLTGEQASTSSGVSPGAHGRIAFNIGGLSGNGPRRSGFNIAFDVHPVFTSVGKALSLTAGFGGEWY